MKRFLRKAAAAALALILIGQAGASVLGDLLLQDTLPLSPETILSESTYRGGTNRLHKERVMTYTPGGTLLPSVVYGNTLYGKVPMDEMEAYPDAWGFSVVAGINGSFFDVDSGIPYGCVITDGAVRTSGNMPSLGLRQDGSAIIGEPGLAVMVTLPRSGAVLDVHVNKTLSHTNGLVLYTRDFEDGTRSQIPAYNIVLRPDHPDLLLGSTITCRVTKVLSGREDCPIPAGGFVLAIAEDSTYASTLETLIKPITPGDTLTVSVSVDDAWKDVVSAFSGMDMLVTDGQAASSFALNTARTRVARTAVGLRSNGSLVLCTVENSDRFTGVTLAELAGRMQELGCVTALNLDGGGSTAIRILYPGMQETQTVGTPTDGGLRKCANFLFLTRPRQTAGAATKLFAYPHNAVCLPGGQIPLTVTATDHYYLPAAVPEDIIWEVSGGQIDDGVFTALTPGDAKITLRSGSAVGGATVHVIRVPDSISVIRQEDGNPIASQTLRSGQPLDLSVTAAYAGQSVYCADSSFVWSCDSSIGTVDENGVFTAAVTYQPVSGKITCSIGAHTQTVTVTVLPDNPFPDTEIHWAREQIRAMYDLGVLQGSLSGDIPFYRPDDSMTRQEFLVALMRYLAATEPPADDIPSEETAESPVEEIPSEETAESPVEEIPSEETTEPPVEEIPSEETAESPVEEIPSEETAEPPAEDIPSEETTEPPAEDIPSEETTEPPAEDIPSEDPSVSPLPFADADRIAPWARDAVAAAYARGYLTGALSDGVLYCHPQNPISRQEAMTILARTLPESEFSADVLSAFPDSSAAAAWAVPGLARMVETGVVGGMSDGTLNPTGPVTRAQVAKMLAVMAAPEVPEPEELPEAPDPENPESTDPENAALPEDPVPDGSDDLLPDEDIPGEDDLLPDADVPTEDVPTEDVPGDTPDPDL